METKYVTINNSESTYKLIDFITVDSQVKVILECMNGKLKISDYSEITIKK